MSKSNDTQKQDATGLAGDAGSESWSPEVEKVARAIARAYVQGWRHGLRMERKPEAWLTTLDEAEDIQWHMATTEAIEALTPNHKSSHARNER